MTEEWLAKVANLRQWQRGGERAPHKPLLLLLALGRLQRTGSPDVPFAEAKSDLTHLLVEFGPPRRPNPGYPFHHLESDGLWSVRTNLGPGSPGSNIGQLVKHEAVGSLAPGFVEAMKTDPRLFATVVRLLLDSNFPGTMHGDILDVAGIDVELIDMQGTLVAKGSGKRRDPAFRPAVLMAYEYRCAVCGYDGQILSEAVGIEAAHVRWWAAEGPDDVSNSVALCSLHHKLFDRGVIGISSNYTINVSQHFIGRSPAADGAVLAFIGKPLLKPQPGQPQPDLKHVAWHAKEVFRTPERVAAG